MFDDTMLIRLVETAGRALEHEDRLITCCSRESAPLYDDDRPPGLLRFPSKEKYYQFLILRGLMAGYPLGADIECEERYDFVLFRRDLAGLREIQAVGEMKIWLSPEGTRELPKVRDDVAKLRGSGHPSFFLVATAWAPGTRDEQTSFLMRNLGEPALQLVHVYEFRTIGWASQRDTNFALLGFSVKTPQPPQDQLDSEAATAIVDP